MAGIGAGREGEMQTAGELREAGVSRMTGIPIDLKFRLTQVNYRSFQLLHPDDSRSSGVTNRAPTSHGGQLMWAALMRTKTPVVLARLVQHHEKI